MNNPEKYLKTFRKHCTFVRKWCVYIKIDVLYIATHAPKKKIFKTNACALTLNKVCIWVRYTLLKMIILPKYTYI